MQIGQLPSVLRYLRQLSQDREGTPLSDGDLWQRFSRHKDGDAFADLVRRHGPMVLGVCRRILGDRHEAEDAFQTTFLVLIRRAGNLRQPELLGPFLYGIASRVALKARTLAARLPGRAVGLEEWPAPATTDELLWRDLRPVLDDAIARLPASYRTSFVLCCLQGLTTAEAARQLRCPPGTVSARLARARVWLRKRLTRRGVVLSASLLASSLVPRVLRAALPLDLLDGTRAAALILAAGQPLTALSPAVASLLKGVCKSMLIVQVRNVLMTLAALIALGALGLGVRAGGKPPGEEPTLILASRAEPAPSVPPQPEEKPTESASVRTTNFEVQAPTHAIAQLVADEAERQRRRRAREWLGKELPAWPKPCPIRVKITNNGSGGATTFNFDKGKVLSQEMQLEGTLERILVNCLPHEVTHSVLAHHVGRPLPRWFDEGSAVLSEDDIEQKRHLDLVRQILNSPGRAIPVRRLLNLKAYPPDVIVLYAEGFSLTRFLVERKDRKTLLDFIAKAEGSDWDRASFAVYGYASVEELEKAWLASLRLQPTAPTPTVEEVTPPNLPVNQRLPRGLPPQTVRAFVDKEERVNLWMPQTYYEPRMVKAQGGQEGMVTTYVTVVGEAARAFQGDNVKAFDTRGKPIPIEKLRELLRKERPVLVSQDGQPVDPFHLQLIKEDAIILIVPLDRLPVPPTVPAVNIPVAPAEASPALIPR